MVNALSRAIDSIDAELYDRVFDGLLRLIVAYVSFRTLCRRFSSRRCSVATRAERPSVVGVSSQVRQGNTQRLRAHRHRSNDNEEDHEEQLCGHLAKLQLW